MPDHATATLAAYEPIAGKSVIDELRQLAGHLAGKRILMVNSTRTGGGVAEILTRMVPLLSELGLDVRWEILEGTEPFYKVTKKFHNALHGTQELFTQELFDLFLEVGRSNAKRLSLEADAVFIHDPQPLPLVEMRKQHPSSRWVWRCHIDVSRPNQAV